MKHKVNRREKIIKIIGDINEIRKTKEKVNKQTKSTKPKSVQGKIKLPIFRIKEEIPLQIPQLLN